MLRPGRLLALLCLAALLPAAPSGAVQCDPAGAARAGRWHVASPPLLGHSANHEAVYGPGRELHRVAVDPANPRTVFVSDGEHLQRSDDGGCRWTVVWQVPEGPGADAPDRDVAQITSIDVAREGKRTRVLLAVAALGWKTPGSARTYLVRSADGRTGWSYVGDPTMLSGTFDPGRGWWWPTVHSAGATAWAAVPATDGTVGYLRSVNGGKTWQLQTGYFSTDAPTSMTGFAVNPYDPNEVWEWGGVANHRGGPQITGLRYTVDAGFHWTPVDPWPMEKADRRPTWYLVDVFWARAGQRPRVLVLGGVQDPRVSEQPPVLSWSGNGGRNFAKVVPPSRTSILDAVVAHTIDGDAVVVAPNGQTFRIACRARAPRASDFHELSPLPVRPSGEWMLNGRDLARASTTSPTVVAVPTQRNVQLLTVVR